MSNANKTDKVFPPVTLLKKLKTFAIDVVAERSDIVPPRLLQLQIGDVLKTAGLNVVSTSEDNDAVLRCHVMTMVTTKNFGGSPANYAYVLRLDVFSPHSEEMSDQIVVVWQNMTLGHWSAENITVKILETARELSESLISRLNS